jgi:hypothetical protein
MGMTVMPHFASFLLFSVLLTFMGAWDGLVRRHVRLSARFRFGDLHIRGIPAVVIGILSAGALYIMLKVGITELGLVSQACDDLGCVVQTTLVSLFFDGWGTVFALLMLGYFILWTLSIREMQGPYQIFPVAPGVGFDECVIVRRIQERLRKAKLEPVSSDIIVRTVCEIRWRGGTFGLYKTRDLGTSPTLHRRSLLRTLGRLDIDALAKLTPRQRNIGIRETVDYIRDWRIRGIKAYPWNRKWLAQPSSDAEDATLQETDG